MENFKAYLQGKQLVSSKKILFYVVWVSKYFSFCDDKKDLDQKQLADMFIRQLSRKYEDWQVAQAREAVKLYRYYQRRMKQDH